MSDARKRKADEPASLDDGLSAGFKDLVFADPYEDVIEDSGSEGDGDEDGSDDADESGAASRAGAGEAGGAGGSSAEARSSRKAAVPQRVFRPGVDTLEAGEALDYDPSAYVMLHQLAVEWPCLSFDIVPDRLGPARTKLPLTATFVAGTQADTPGANKLLVMRAANLTKTQEKPPRDEDDDGSSSSDDDEEDEDAEDPDLYVHRLPHHGGVNRVRVMPQEPHVVASWSDTGKVHLYDIRHAVRQLDAEEGKLSAGGAASSSGGSGAGGAPGVHRSGGPVFTFAGHRTEGYAVDFSPASPGRLATGDCSGTIHVWDCNAAAASAFLASEVAVDPASIWSLVDAKAGFSSHSASVEDIQWSPNESTVFATCSADRTVRIWDTRAKGRAMITVEAASCDVNVISWSRLVSFLMASGADDGSFRIWDLRNFKSDSSVAQFRWHTRQITAIEWAYDDENVLTVGSADNQVTIWDLSLEGDDDAEVALAAATAGDKGAAEAAVPSTRDPRMADIPPQLLFIHAGQEDVKEVHFHRQLPGVVFSTASDGFNIFKPDLQLTT